MGEYMKKLVLSLGLSAATLLCINQPVKASDTYKEGMLADSLRFDTDPVEKVLQTSRGICEALPKTMQLTSSEAKSLSEKLAGYRVSYELFNACYVGSAKLSKRASELYLKTGDASYQRMMEEAQEMASSALDYGQVLEEMMNTTKRELNGY
jgi:hypothetical protein